MMFSRRTALQLGTAALAAPMVLRAHDALASSGSVKVLAWQDYIQPNIAEKFEALVRLDAQNTRMKDFFDLDYLLAQGEIKRDTIDAAIKATFKRRGSALPAEIPTGLTEKFAADQSSMWIAFLGKNGLKDDAFEKVVARIRDRLKWVWEN